MKVVRMKSNPNMIIFTNHDRIDEEKLFRQVKSLLDQNSSVSWGRATDGPSEDLLEGKIDGLSFTLIYDLNYGPEIYSDSEDAIRQLQEYLNGV